MNLINGQTNYESVVVGAVTLDIGPGVAWSLRGPVTVRSIEYADTEDEDCTVLIGPGGVVQELSPSDWAYLDTGHTAGVTVGACLLAVMAIRAGLNAGLERGH